MKFNLLNLIVLIILISSSCYCQKIVIKHPQNLFQQNPINFTISPIGYRPLSGTLYGKIHLSQPLSACSTIKTVHQCGNNENIFIMSNDQDCLLSIKAMNIAQSNAVIGIIKQNINKSHHERQNNLVHIPIIQIQPKIFDTLFSNLNNSVIINIIIDFTSQKSIHDINIQLWLSSTEISMYDLLINLQQFFKNSESTLSIQPHYIFDSQNEIQSYLGCLSSGKYCPVELQWQGRIQGTDIVRQNLRQIIIRTLSIKNWWIYIKQYRKNCLPFINELLNKNTLKQCSQNCMLNANIDQKQVYQQYSASFEGNGRQLIDNNIVLIQQQQIYINQHLSRYPIILINKKQYYQFDSNSVKSNICAMKSDNININGCQNQIEKKNNNNNSNLMFEIGIIIGVIVTVMIIVLIAYRIYLKWKIKKQIKLEVNQTLEQYYRYIETFEGENGQVGLGEKNMKIKQNLEQKQYEQLNQQKTEQNVEMQNMHQQLSTVKDNLKQALN